MRAAKNLSIMATVAAVMLAVFVTPARAVAPERYEIAFVNAAGQLMDCVRIRSCGEHACWARALYTRRWGKCTPIEQFEPGRTRLSCSYKNVDWSFWAYDTKEVVLDITCSRFGKPWNFIGGKYSSGPPLTCSAVATYRRLQGSDTYTEAYIGLTVERYTSCRRLFGDSLTPVEWENLNVWKYVP